MKAIVITCMFCGFLFTHTSAGWIIKEKIYDTDNKEITNQIVFIQDNKIKQVGEDFTTVFNLDDNTITLYRPEIRIYWKGTVDEYKREMHETYEIMMKMELEKIPSDQQESAEEMFKKMMKVMENPDLTTEPSMDVLIRQTADNENIAGYNSSKYQVFINGILKEDIWVSEEVNVSEDLDIRKFYHQVYQLSGGFRDDFEYQSGAQYIQLIEKGYFLRSKDYQYGFQTITEVTEITEKDLPESEFDIPAGYKKVSLPDLGIFNGSDEE